MAFIRQPVKGKLHHASFELGSEKVLRAADILAHEDFDRPGADATRHHARRDHLLLDPSGNRNEVFSRLHLHPDKPAITWYDETLGPAIFYHDRQLNDAFLSVFT